MRSPHALGTARRWATALALAVIAAASAHLCEAAEAPARSLRVGIPWMPEVLDPARAPDMLTWYVLAGIYDTLYVLDPVARPAAIAASAAAALPEVSADGRTFTMRLKPGIFFTPHPSFGGKPRELAAADFAYALKRIVDPKVRSPAKFLVAGKVEGLDELAQRASSAGTALDYDAPVPGIAVTDRYTLRIRLKSPEPTFPFVLASAPLAGIAREVIEASNENAIPVGTGAFVVANFVPGQRLVLTRNAAYRSVHWEDLLSAASRRDPAAHPMRGRRLPGTDRLEFSSTPEAASELLALRRGELDLIYLSSPELAIDNGALKATLARDRIQLVRNAAPIVFFTAFSMRDPVLGGSGRDNIALRRAIAMAFDDAEWIRVFDAGLATVTAQMIPAAIEGHVPHYRNPNAFDPAGANALLDKTGYRRGRDGYRRNPDGSPLVVTMLTGTSSKARAQAEFHKRMLDRIGIRVSFEALPSSERFKRTATCQYGMTGLDWAFDVPDGTNVMSAFSSKALGSGNSTCFADALFDAAYDKALVEPAGQSRSELFRTMQARLDAMAVIRMNPSREILLLKRPGVLGPFATVNDWLQVLTLGMETSASPRR